MNGEKKATGRPRGDRVGVAIASVFVGVSIAWGAIGIGEARADDKPVVRIGSKRFTESNVLGEIGKIVAERAGEARAEHKEGLGGTADREADLVAQGVEKHLPQVREDRAFAPRLERVHVIERLEQRDLQEIVGIRERARVCRKPSARPAAQQRQESRDETFARRAVSFPHTLEQQRGGFERCRRRFVVFGRFAIGQRSSVSRHRKVRRSGRGYRPVARRFKKVMGLGAGALA